jgi:hypothetical protein
LKDWEEVESSKLEGKTKRKDNAENAEARREGRRNPRAQSGVTVPQSWYRRARGTVTQRSPFAKRALGKQREEHRVHREERARRRGSV